MLYVLRVASAPFVAWAMLALAAGGAAAQPSESFADVGLKVKIGQDVIVRDAQGRELQGRLTALTPSALEIATQGGLRWFAQTDIRELARRGDTVLNGAVIGSGAGATLGALTFGSFSGEFRAGDAAAAGLIFGAVGAGIGLLIDAMIEGRTVVYRSGRRLAVMPVATRHGASVQVTVRWPAGTRRRPHMSGRHAPAH